MIEQLKHQHIFDTGNQRAERGARWVMWITLIMMLIEIAAGLYFNSMALLSDGLHMSSHAFAIGLSAFAYVAARRYAHDQRFAFGTWKIEILCGFASAVVLVGIAVLMLIGSIERLITPKPIAYQEAIIVAIIGLVINLICASILGHAHHHHGDEHHHHHHHDTEDHHHHDLNLKAAYIHVITDAATSVLAIVALLGGWFYGWNWLDPAMGILGSVLVIAWAKRLLQDTSKVLLDREMDHPVVDEIREAIRDIDPSGTLTDLHVWRVGRTVYACELCLVTHNHQLTPQDIRDHLKQHEELVHCTIELHFSSQKQSIT